MGVEITSPSTVALLACLALMAMYMHRSASKVYAAPGRKEMMFFLDIYIISLVLNLLLVGGFGIPDDVYRYLTFVQLAVNSAAIFALLMGCITSSLFSSVGCFRSIAVLRYSTLLYLVVVGYTVGFGLATENAVIIFVISFMINALLAFLFLVFQIAKLHSNDAEVWAYGTLGIASTLFVLASIFPFCGSELLSQISDGYVDGLFAFNLLMSSSVIMIYKYWLSVSDIEAECATLMLNESL